MNTRTPFRASAVSAVVLSAVVLAGCSGASDSAPSDAGTAPETVVALAGDIDNFDPHTNQLNIYEYAIRELVFSSLVDYDVDLNLQPDLAEYEVNEDATQFTFSLDADAVFQDGTDVDAAAVVSSLERAADASNSIWSGRLADVKSYETPDDDTVVITLNSPNAAFLAGLASIAIIAPDATADVAKKPVGSGPYSFVSWTPNSEIVLERFDDYFGTQGASERIVYRPVSDQQVALNNLYSGDIDIISSITSATKGQFDATRAQLVEPSASNSMSLIEFNSSGALADVRVRQALAYALDKDAIREIAYGGAGASTWSPLPESSWAYAEQTGYPYDLDKAEALLVEAGAEGLSFTLEIPSGFPDAEQIARVWQSSLAEIGVTLTPNVTELSVWLDAYVSRSYDATWNTFNVGADPNSYFDIIMQPHLADDYPNAQVQQLVSDAVAVSDESERAEIYAQLQKILVDELPVMTVQSTPIYSAAANGVSGYAVNPLGWSLLAGASVSE
ncbi:ABC transporter substrate-binding protein [Microbacterium tenebrionis]|uniref:ABC transporter substrate-binding protein n=1 Tax=Microbacterium tenebrionis TaxID=2830665 RepID=UPI00158F4DC4|nr:ABC transporter substrate-binding protein [Microbacterium ihumii]